MSARRHGTGHPPDGDQAEPSGAGGVPVSAVDVRQRVRLALAGSGERYDPRAVEDALLVASELATNAMVHGGGITGFRARVVDGLLEVAIGDRADGMPATLPRRPGDPRPGGFGWPIIRRLALRVTVERNDPTVSGPYRALLPHPAGRAGPTAARGKTITVALPLR